MHFPETSTWLTILAYAVASAVSFIAMTRKKGSMETLASILTALAFLCQTLQLAFGFHASLPEGLSIGAYFQLFAWFILLCALGFWFFLHQNVPLLFAAPLGLILFLMSAPLLGRAMILPGYLKTSFYALHIGALFLSLGLLALGCTAAILFLFLERRIKGKQKMPVLWQNLPSLALLDRINSICVLLSFPLYTIGIAAGLLWAKPVFGASLSGDPKEILSIFVWLLLATLFHNRLAKGWKGRKPAIMILSIFSLSLLSLVGAYIFLDSRHTFIRS